MSFGQFSRRIFAENLHPSISFQAQITDWATSFYSIVRVYGNMLFTGECLMHRFIFYTMNSLRVS